MLAQHGTEICVDFLQNDLRIFCRLRYFKLVNILRLQIKHIRQLTFSQPQTFVGGAAPGAVVELKSAFSHLILLTGALARQTCS